MKMNDANQMVKVARMGAPTVLPQRSPFSPYPPLSPKNRNPVPSIPDAS